MEKLIHELMRLYFPAGLSAALLGPRIAGAHGEPLALHEAGRTRAIVLPFARNRADDRAGDAGAHWRRLCEAANLLQARYDFPRRRSAFPPTEDFACGYRWPHRSRSRLRRPSSKDCATACFRISSSRPAPPPRRSNCRPA
ncbi:hypothetical protein [Massilia sp. Se16.2.3]|uniref:hypothetical protein n=1 Tax=Massilia sp. Se16.2.3 TaxID=2709303 RepID=UPI001E4A09F4|nr:hypothetical protein [Massilia sp. Se16.2.3]